MVTAATVALQVGALGAFVVLDHLTGVLSWPDLGCDDRRPIDVQAALARMPGLADTGPPVLTADRLAICTACGAAVPYASMALDEHGYFCPRCSSLRR